MLWKTKPTQHSVKGLRSLGLIPDILACLNTTELDENVKAKLAQICHVAAQNIITLYDVSNIWHIPLLLKGQKAHEAILKVLNLSRLFLSHFKRMEKIIWGKKDHIFLHISFRKRVPHHQRLEKCPKQRWWWELEFKGTRSHRGLAWGSIPTVHNFL